VGGSSGGSFATLTHARLRAAQGDVGGAVRILRVILTVQPEHDEARAMLAKIEGRVNVSHREPEGLKAGPVEGATAHDLKRRFRDALESNEPSGPAGRLARWLERTKRNRGTRHAE